LTHLHEVFALKPRGGGDAQTRMTSGPRSLSDFYTNRRIRSPIDQFRLSYAKFSDLDATEKPKLRVAEQIKRKSDRLLGMRLTPVGFGAKPRLGPSACFDERGWTPIAARRGVDYSGSRGGAVCFSLEPLLCGVTTMVLPWP
jgi:hypothetical protein